MIVGERYEIFLPPQDQSKSGPRFTRASPRLRDYVSSRKLQDRH
jgi:hypothetical protein